jgi:hypothetical protein
MSASARVSKSPTAGTRTVTMAERQIDGDSGAAVDVGVVQAAEVTIRRQWRSMPVEADLFTVAGGVRQEARVRSSFETPPRTVSSTSPRA